jgi:uncharacterized protein
MLINRDQPSSANYVTAYASGGVTVGSQVLRTSFVMDARNIHTDWPVANVACLTIEHLDQVIAMQPEIILLGTGDRIEFPANEIRAAVLSRGIGFEIMDTPAACRTFNILVAEDRRVVAALIVATT